MQDIISTLKNALQQAEAGLEVAVGRLAKDGTERGDFKPSEVLALASVREVLAMPVTCLHRIQEPAATEQSAWHAGLDEGRAQATGSVSNATCHQAKTGFSVSNAETPQSAPAAVPVPDERAAFEKWWREWGLGGIDVQWEAWQARAALAATPAAAPAGWKLVPIEPTSEMLESAGAADRDGTPATYKTLYMAMVGASPAAAPVVLPEPDAVLLNQGVELLHALSNDERNRGNCSSAEGATASAYAVQRLAALLATGGQAQAVKLLAADHSGMKVDYRGLFSQVQRALKRTDPGYAEMLRQLEGHLQELGQRWYAGDTDVVDEILQLYCIERDARKTVGVTATAAPQAQADARDAEQEVLMEHSGCGSNTQVDMLTVRLNPGDKVVMHKGRITQGFDRANRAAIAAAKGE